LTGFDRHAGSSRHITRQVASALIYPRTAACGARVREEAETSQPEWRTAAWSGGARVREEAGTECGVGVE